MPKYTPNYSQLELDLIPYGYCRCGCGKLAPVSKTNDKNKGHVKGEPHRFIQGHATRRSYIDRFWEKVDKRGPDDCWIWKGCITNGRGAFHLNGKDIRASRMSYEIHYNQAPGDLCVCHACDNPMCVNPAHLWLGSQKDNVQDMLSKGRRPKGRK